MSDGNGEMVRDDEQRTWEDVERLLSDLKADGYAPILIATTTSAAAPQKAIQINVERDKHTVDGTNE